MTEPYLPQWATAQEAGEWLEFRTGQRWPMARLVEAGVNMAAWLDCEPDAPPEVVEHLFQGRREGFLAPVVFASDLMRLAAARDGVTLSMTRRPDGELMKLTPPPIVAADDLRFSRESIRAVAIAVERGALLRGEGNALVFEFENGSSLGVDVHGLELHGVPARLDLWPEQTTAAPEAPPAPASEPAAEPQAVRQARRYQLCVDAGLPMPTDDYARLPTGIRAIADREGIARQSLSEDLKAHIRRLNGR